MIVTNKYGKWEITACSKCDGDGSIEVCTNEGWYQGSEATPTYKIQTCDECDGEGKVTFPLEEEDEDEL
ncbi:MAG: hypothetical protein H8D23_21665 [Candidatus Brocadiales bacterium]|nr:hypothetical protein [Candidatus Brocadiales bacterium]